MSTLKVQRPSATPRFSSSKTRRGSLSSPCLPTIGTTTHHLAGSANGSSSVEAMNSADKRATSGSRASSALALFNRTVGLSQFRLGGTSEKGKSRSQLDTGMTTTGPSGFGSTSERTSSKAEVRRGSGVASYLANEILLLIFRHLMDRKTILNCSLVSSHWHGPARSELERIVQDMPFNGQGLVRAIRYGRCNTSKQVGSFVLSCLFPSFLLSFLLLLMLVVKWCKHLCTNQFLTPLSQLFFSFPCMKKNQLKNIGRVLQAIRSHFFRWHYLTSWCATFRSFTISRIQRPRLSLRPRTRPTCCTISFGLFCLSIKNFETPGRVPKSLVITLSISCKTKVEDTRASTLTRRSSR